MPKLFPPALCSFSFSVTCYICPMDLLREDRGRIDEAAVATFRTANRVVESSKKPLVTQPGESTASALCYRPHPVLPHSLHTNLFTYAITRDQRDSWRKKKLKTVGVENRSIAMTAETNWNTRSLHERGRGNIRSVFLCSCQAPHENSSSYFLMIFRLEDSNVDGEKKFTL